MFIAFDYCMHLIVLKPRKLHLKVGKWYYLTKVRLVRISRQSEQGSVPISSDWRDSTVFCFRFYYIGSLKITKLHAF